MIKEINLLFPPRSLKTILSYAVSSDTDSIYKDYRHIPNRKLFGCQKDGQLIGCIGGEKIVILLSSGISLLPKRNAAAASAVL